MILIRLQFGTGMGTGRCPGDLGHRDPAEGAAGLGGVFSTHSFLFNPTFQLDPKRLFIALPGPWSVTSRFLGSGMLSVELAQGLGTLRGRVWECCDTGLGDIMAQGLAL